MAVETIVILKEMYRVLLSTESIEEAREALRVMLDEEQASHVEKIVEERKKRKE